VFAVSDDDLTASLTFIEVTAVAGWLADVHIPFHRRRCGE
jgi:hypothetical protein